MSVSVASYPLYDSTTHCQRWMAILFTRTRPTTPHSFMSPLTPKCVRCQPRGPWLFYLFYNFFSVWLDVCNAFESTCVQPRGFRLRCSICFSASRQVLMWVARGKYYTSLSLTELHGMLYWHPHKQLHRNATRDSRVVTVRTGSAPPVIHSS